MNEPVPWYRDSHSAVCRTKNAKDPDILILESSLVPS